MKIVNVDKSVEWVVSYLTTYFKRKTGGVERIFFYLKMKDKHISVLLRTSQ